MARSEIKNVAVLGTGVLGSQIIYQTAYHGFRVTAYDIDEAALDLARQRLTGYAAAYPSEMPQADAARASAVPEDITYTTDLELAAADADLVIEAVPEYLGLKQDTFRKLARVAPPKTIFASNSSTLLPSQIKDSTNRPDRYLHLHFANHIWVRNVAEIMGSPDTDPGVFERVVAFAEDIGMVPIEVQKEEPGYVLNALMVPFLQAAGGLIADDVASPETVDATWRIGAGSPLGPAQYFDIIGLNTVYAIAVSSEDERQQRFAAHLKEKYIDKGNLGVTTGQGFYTY